MDSTTLLALFVLVHCTLALNIKSEDGNREIRVTGVLPAYDWETQNGWNAMITVESDTKPSIVYCNGQNVGDKIEYREELAKHTYTIPMLPTSEMLDSMFSKIGTRCTVILDVDKQPTPFRFFLRTDDVYVPDKRGKTPLALLGEEFKRASHLTWIAIAVLVVTLIIVLLVPCIMIINNRRNGF